MDNFTLECNNLIRYNGTGGDVIIPDGVVEIFNYAFSGCNVTSITLPASVQRIGFWHCPQLVAFYVDPENNAFCEKDGILYSRDMKSLERCPEAYTGEVLIPKGVEVIRFGAFSHCSLITSVRFPETLVEILGEAFYGCSAIKTLVLPDSLTEIGQGAFGDMDSLTSLMIPRNVSRFGEYQSDVINSRHFKRIDVDADNKTYKSIDGILFSKTGKNVQFCPRGKTGVVTLPESARTINGSAFAGCVGITEIAIPSKVTKIGSRAFDGCSSLQAITIPDGIKRIEPYTFAGCSGLKSVQLNEGVALIEDRAFENCSALKTIVLPKTVAKISKTAFSDGIAVACCAEMFKKLDTQVKIKTAIEYLKNIGGYTQEQRAGVEDFIMGSNGKVLKAIIEQEDIETLIRYNAVHSLTQKEIASSIEAAIKDGHVQITAALLEIQNQEKRVFGKKAPEISNPGNGNKATSVGTNKLDWKRPKTGSTMIGRYAGNAANITYPLKYGEIEISGTADVSGSIPDNYKNIESIIIPEGYRSIGRNTFAGCEKLVSVTLPSTLRAIGVGAFKGCKSLRTLLIPEGVTSFGEHMFDECSFDTVELPSSLEFLPKHCFDGAIIDTIIFRGSVLIGDGRVFDFGNEPRAIYTDGKIKLYNITKRVIKPLKELTNRGIAKEKTEAEIRKEWSVTQLENGTLRIDDYKGLDSDIIIPERIAGKTVTEIGDGVFDRQRKISALQRDVREHISSITVPPTVVKIGKEAFKGCTVKVVKLPDRIIESKTAIFGSLDI